MNLKSSKTIHLLQLLTNVELKDFDKWLRSPWCNSNKKLIVLFNILKKFHPDFDAKKLNKEWIFKRLYPDKLFNDRWLRNLLAALSEQVRQFVVHQHLQATSELREHLFIKALQIRDKVDWFIKSSLASTAQISNQKTPLTTQDYLYLFQLNEQLYFQPNTPYRQEEIAPPLSLANKALDRFYWLNKLRLIAEFKERKKRLRTLDGAEGFLLFPQNLQQLDLPAIGFYQNRVDPVEMALSPGVKETYLLYKTQFAHLERRDRKILLYYLINDASRLFNSGEVGLLKTILEIYQFGIAEELLIHNGLMTENTYLNIVSVGIALKEKQFVEEFIEKYTSWLTKKSQTDARKWATSKSYYYRQQYQLCIDEIKDHPFKVTTFVYRARVLLLQSFFEQLVAKEEKHDMLLHYCHAFEVQLRADKRLSATRRKPLWRFVGIVQKMVRWNEDINRSEESWQKLYATFRREKNIQGRPWLKEKLEQLKERLP